MTIIRDTADLVHAADPPMPRARAAAMPIAARAVRYRPDIDGLRAVAVASVIIYHAFAGVLPGGFLGVDVFFVISGYLITQLILRDLHERSFSLAEFYRRRARRILPALLVVLAGSALFSATCRLVEEPIRFGTIRQRAVPALLWALAGCAILGTGLERGWVTGRLSNPAFTAWTAAVADWSFPAVPQKNPPGTVAAWSRRGKTALFIGDSHIQQYWTRARRIVATHPLSARSALFATHTGCPPLPDVEAWHRGAGCSSAFRRDAVPVPDHISVDDEKRSVDAREFESYVEPLMARLREIAARSGAIVVDPRETLCAGMAYPATDARGLPVHVDSNHLTAAYAEEHATFIDTILLAPAIPEPAR